MKTSRKFIIALSLLSLLGLATFAQADYINDCQGVNFKGFHFGWCQAHYHPYYPDYPYGPYVPYNPYGPNPYWHYHHHHYWNNCWIQYTQWGPVKRCRVY